MKELLMGNEAVALGALAAGVQVVSGYRALRPRKYLRP